MDKKEALDALYEYHKEDKEAQNVFKQALSHSFWDIKLLGIEYLNDSILDLSIDLKNKMLELAQTDPYSYVRGDALDHLYEYYGKDDDLVGVQESAIKDSSYYVLTTGLHNLLRMDEEKGRKYANEFAEEAKSEVLTTIADFYSTNGNKTDNSFFVSTLKKINTDDRWEIIDYYVSYLLDQQNDSLIKISLPVLETITREESSWYNRYSGFLGLQDYQRDLLFGIGGGLAGGLMATYLGRAGFRADVYEKRPDLRSTKRAMAMPPGAGRKSPRSSLMCALGTKTVK
ncbi:MAG: hypothetical protein IH948_08515, partial [Bacteroidetes bacterium]|nr:hypothetical protein [Bacteroidota bacterium]